MRYEPADLPAALIDFVTERHLATLTTLRPDGTPHVAPVGFTLDAATGLVRVITFSTATKLRNLPGPASVCQVDGGRWVTFEGSAVVTDDPARNAEGVNRYAQRYRQPKDREDRRTIEITIERVMGSAGLSA